MSHQCPACQRTFDEPGFCPFDGKQLVMLDVAHKQTVVSEQMAAQAEPRTVDDAHAAARTLPSSQFRAVSAATQPGTAVAGMSPRSEYDALVGQTLDGRYHIQRKLGEGGMGVVYAARHAVIERKLAIKVLKREVMRDAATIKRFVQEARAASRVGHPSIVDVTDFGQTPDGMTYSVMEYVDGVTLAKTIRAAAPMPPERSIQIAIQIARALGAAHDKGIVHRDLKPENVFLTARDERPDFVKIVDFGIAKVQPIEGHDPNEPRLTRAGTVIGTPEYMAPEQAAGRNDTDGRADIYALGTILYEMTVGRTPHKSDSMVRTIAMQMLDPILPPSQLHPDLAVPKPFELVIMKALAKRREERFQTMGEFAAALERVLAAVRVPDPTLALPSVPPGAELPAGMPAVTPLKSTAPATAEIKRAKPETRPLHEPEFVAKGPVSVTLPLPVAPVALDDQDRPPRRWPAALISVLLLGAGGGAVWYATRASRDRDVVAAADGGARLVERERDGGVELTADATSDVPGPLPLSPDARVVVVVPPPSGDGGVLDPIATLPDHPEHPANVTVEVLTRPAEANVFVGRTFRGPSGARLTEPFGTTLSIECRLPHYVGKVKVVFDGTRDSVMCTAVRLKMCVDGLKNPYDDCEPKPTP